MDIIKWRATYETGVPSMDEQHRQLIDLINSLYRVLRKEESVETIGPILDDMAAYADKHLREEEALLQKHDFPGYDEHLLLHNNYQEELAALTRDWEQQDELTAKKIYAFLRQWWLEHIVENDQKYGNFLTEKGVK